MDRAKLFVINVLCRIKQVFYAKRITARSVPADDRENFTRKFGYGTQNEGVYRTPDAPGGLRQKIAENTSGEGGPKDVN